MPLSWRGTEWTLYYIAEGSELETYNSEYYAQAMAHLIGEKKPEIVLIGHSMQGKDLAPRTAAKLGVAAITDCVSFELDGSTLIGNRPMYAGKCYVQWVAVKSPQIASVRPNVLEVTETPGAGTVEKVSINLDKSRSTYVTKDLNLDTSGKIDLTEAEIIVSGGRGMGGPDYSLLEEMAAIFGSRATVGASRPRWTRMETALGPSGANRKNSYSESVYCLRYFGLYSALGGYGIIQGHRCHK